MIESLDSLEAFIQNLVEQDRFSGAVLVTTTGGDTCFQGVYGLANKRYAVPNQLDTRFNLGSMNKMFTGVAICQLAQAGALAFDDPVGRFIPDYANREVAQKVTLHHLLTHTAGLGSYWNKAFIEGAKDRFRTVQDFINLFAADPLLFEPGTSWEYSNSGFIVLGAVIEAVTGQDYFTYVMDHIHKPAGMTSTDCYEMDRPVPNLAIGYTRMTQAADGTPQRGQEWRSNLFLHVVKGGPAGGGFSTVADLTAFANALLNHQLLDAKHTELLMTGKVQTKRGEGSAYAYGFFDWRINGARVVGHGGGFPGISANLDMFLDHDCIAVVLSNYDGGAIIMTEKIREILISEG